MGGGDAAGFRVRAVKRNQRRPLAVVARRRGNRDAVVIDRDHLVPPRRAAELHGRGADIGGKRGQRRAGAGDRDLAYRLPIIIGAARADVGEEGDGHVAIQAAGRKGKRVITGEVHAVQREVPNAVILLHLFGGETLAADGGALQKGADIFPVLIRAHEDIQAVELPRRQSGVQGDAPTDANQVAQVGKAVRVGRKGGVGLGDVQCVFGGYGVHRVGGQLCDAVLRSNDAPLLNVQIRVQSAERRSRDPAVKDLRNQQRGIAARAVGREEGDVAGRIAEHEGLRTPDVVAGAVIEGEEVAAGGERGQADEHAGPKRRLKACAGDAACQRSVAFCVQNGRSRQRAGQPGIHRGGLEELYVVQSGRAARGIEFYTVLPVTVYDANAQVVAQRAEIAADELRVGAGGQFHADG